MRTVLFAWIVAGMRRLLIVLAVALTPVGAALGQTDQPIAEPLRIHQYHLAAEGRALLEKEARAASGLSRTRDHSTRLNHPSQQKIKRSRGLFLLTF